MNKNLSDIEQKIAELIMTLKDLSDEAQRLTMNPSKIAKNWKKMALRSMISVKKKLHKLEQEKQSFEDKK